MSLAPGARIGPYEVREPLGKGGMGEVFRARDTALGRDVALKFLPRAFAADADRLARFEREAQALASLNHPNIAQVYAIEQVPAEPGGSPGRAIVMELVEGEDLSVRLGRGAVPLDEAGHTHFDVTADGRFLMIENPNQGTIGRQEIHVVLNWFEELRKIR